MKTRPHPQVDCAARSCRGTTLIELSVVLAVMLMLTSVVVFSIGGISEWKLARSASLDLKAVYMAQKSFLADHPTASIADIAASDLVPYLPGGMAAIPKVEALDGAQLDINFNVMPPVAMSGGQAYDPSGKSQDGLWDVGPP